MQEVEFLAPVYLNREYKAIAEVIGKDRRHVYFSTWVEDSEGKQVITGKGTAIPITERARKNLK